jgi:hypothetical protein
LEASARQAPSNIGRSISVVFARPSGFDYSTAILDVGGTL